jgi:holliday junction DNA helicase RuvB
VPAGVFAQDPLELFRAADFDEEPGETADPEWIRNTQ